LEQKSKVNAHAINEDVVYWTWINPTTIGLVTESAVYHWSTEEGAQPIKKFDRHQNLTGCQIINYQASADGKWLFVVGISAQVS
jgi:clathrin heavy chain